MAEERRKRADSGLSTNSEGEEHDSFCYYTMLAIMVVPPALAAAYKMLCQTLRVSIYICVAVVMLTICLLLSPILLPLSLPIIGLALLIKFMSYTQALFSQTDPSSANSSPRTRHRRHKKRSFDHNANGFNGHCNGHEATNGHATSANNGTVEGFSVEQLNGSGIIHTNGTWTKSRH